ncbi:MAG: hypothetical protein ACK500_04900 [Flavobacteriales bacterium]|jgi:hypothetical protein
MTAHQKAIAITYLIGAPFGLLAVCITLFLPVVLSGEGLTGMGLIAIYGKATFGLLISFFIALGIAGHRVVYHMQSGKSALDAAFRFSLTVNAIIWTVFLLITYTEHREYPAFLILPLIALTMCTVLSTFTIGLLICVVIKRKVNPLTI